MVQKKIFINPRLIRVVQVIENTKLLANEELKVILHYENMIYLKFCTAYQLKTNETWM